MMGRFNQPPPFYMPQMPPDGPPPPNKVPHAGRQVVTSVLVWVLILAIVGGGVFLIFWVLPALHLL